jgi:hypothetical protein
MAKKSQFHAVSAGENRGTDLNGRFSFPVPAHFATTLPWPLDPGNPCRDDDVIYLTGCVDYFRVITIFENKQSRHSGMDCRNPGCRKLRSDCLIGWRLT